MSESRSPFSIPEPQTFDTPFLRAPLPNDASIHDDGDARSDMTDIDIHYGLYLSSSASFSAHEAQRPLRGLAMESETVNPSQIHSSTESGSEFDDAFTVEAYAQLHFRDAVYSVKELSVVLGRDKQIEKLNQARRIPISNSSAQPRHPEQPLPALDHANGNQLSRSSDEDDDGEPELIDDEYESENDEYASEEIMHESEVGGIVRENPGRPIPLTTQHGEPFLPIHPPNHRIREISALHLRLHWDTEECVWKLSVLGRNGAFVNKVFYGPDAEVLLRPGDGICVAGLEFGFEPIQGDGKKLSDIEGGGVSESEISHSSTSGVRSGHDRVSRSVHLPRPSARANEENDQVEDQEDEEDEESENSRASANVPARKMTHQKSGKSSIKIKSGSNEAKIRKKAIKEGKKWAHEDQTPSSSKANADEAVQSFLKPGEELPKRRGPGRPPANGIMSKREMRERAKERKQTATNRNGGETDVGPARKSNSQSKTMVNGDGTKAGPSTQKSRKRKRSDTVNDVSNKRSTPNVNVNGTTATGVAKRSPTPRSPSPKREELTEAQLKRPNLTYTTIVYEILKVIFPKAYNLQELYRAIGKKYPYYKYEKSSHGWESSVRHTIAQHYFKKVEKDGKGWKVTIDENVPPPAQRTRTTTTTTTAPAPNYRDPVNGMAQQPRPVPAYSQPVHPSPYTQHPSNPQGTHTVFQNSIRPPFGVTPFRPGIPGPFPSNNLNSGPVPNRPSTQLLQSNNLQASNSRVPSGTTPPQPNGIASLPRPPGLAPQPLRPQASSPPQDPAYPTALQNGQQGKTLQQSQQTQSSVQQQQNLRSLEPPGQPTTTISAHYPPATQFQGVPLPPTTQTPFSTSSPSQSNTPRPPSSTHPPASTSSAAQAPTNRPTIIPPRHISNNTSSPAPHPSPFAKPPPTPTPKPPPQARQTSLDTRLSGLEQLRRGQNPTFFDAFRDQFAPQGTPSTMINKVNSALSWLRRNGPDVERPRDMDKYIASVVDLCLDSLRKEDSAIKAGRAGAGAGAEGGSSDQGSVSKGNGEASEGDAEDGGSSK